MSHAVICTDMLQGSIMPHHAFLFCLANSVAVWSSEKLIFIFTKFKITASAISVRELNVL
jgi:hypothetical protein